MLVSKEVCSKFVTPDAGNQSFFQVLKVLANKTSCQTRNCHLRMLNLSTNGVVRFCTSKTSSNLVSDLFQIRNVTQLTTVTTCSQNAHL